jgi:nucleotide-binding universal stress UspA family protein
MTPQVERSMTSATDPDPGGKGAALGPVEVAQVVVAVDGSDRSAASVPIARQIGGRLDAGITVLAVLALRQDRSALEQHVEQLATEVQGKSLVIDADDVPGAILGAISEVPSHVLCMGSHGRGRSASVVGSVTAAVAAQSREPFVVVGPNVPPAHAVAGRLVACVDGSARSESVLPAAASWAAALGLGLSIVTVAEPIPEPLTPGAPYRRNHGPQVAAEPYIGELVQRWQDRGVQVDGDVVYDPVSVAGGLADFLASRPAALVAVATRARSGVARLVLGSHAANIVRAVPAPILLVPETS